MRPTDLQYISSCPNLSSKERAQSLDLVAGKGGRAQMQHLASELRKAQESAPLGVARGGGQPVGSTHIDEVVPVSNEQVAKNACLIEISQADHVLHTMD